MRQSFFCGLGDLVRHFRFCIKSCDLSSIKLAQTEHWVDIFCCILSILQVRFLVLKLKLTELKTAAAKDPLWNATKPLSSVFYLFLAILDEILIEVTHHKVLNQAFILYLYLYFEVLIKL